MLQVLNNIIVASGMTSPHSGGANFWLTVLVVAKSQIPRSPSQYCTLRSSYLATRLDHSLHVRSSRICKELPRYYPYIYQNIAPSITWFPQTNAFQNLDERWLEEDTKPVVTIRYLIVETWNDTRPQLACDPISKTTNLHCIYMYMAAS